MSLNSRDSVHDLSDSEDLDSLPSSSSSSVSMDSLSTDADQDAQEEWERSMNQLQALLTMVLVPFAGKYFGRQFAYWGWARYMEWMHNVEIRWTNKKAFKAVGAVEAAATL